MKSGEWIEGDNGYGIIIKIIPKYYQYGDGDIPSNKKIGDKKQDTILLKRFCSFDFKVYPQTRLISKTLTSKTTKKDMLTINELLKDDKIAKRFKNYKLDDICEVGNYNQNLKKSKIKTIKLALEKLTTNNHLQMTYREIENHLRKEFNIELYEDPYNTNCYIQLISDGVGKLRNKEMLFKKIDIIEQDGNF